MAKTESNPRIFDDYAVFTNASIRIVTKRGHGGLVIGSEMSGDVRNVFLEDCDFQGTDRAIRIKSRADRGGVVENIFARNLRVHDMQREVIILNMGYTADRGELLNARPPVFRDMVFEDITGIGASTAILMRGLDDSPIRNIVFRKLTVTSEKGVYAEHIRHVTFDQVQIAPKSGPVFKFNQASDVKMKASDSPEGASVFLELKGKNSQDIIIDACDLSLATTPVVIGKGVARSAVIER